MRVDCVCEYKRVTELAVMNLLRLYQTEVAALLGPPA